MDSLISSIFPPHSLKPYTYPKMQSFNFSDLPEEATIDLIKELVSYISATECTPNDTSYIQHRYEKMLDALTKMCMFSEKFSRFVVADQRAEKKAAHDYR